MIGAALLIGVIRKVLLMYGLSRTSPIDGSIIDTITPLLVLLISVVLGIDKFTRLKIAGLVLGMAGAVGVVLLGASGGHTHSGLVGNLMIAGCALATSCYMVWFKKLIARYDVVTMLRWVYCLAALMVLPFGARELVHTDFAAMDTDILLATLFVVFVPTYVPNLLLNYSLKYVQPTVSSIYTYLQPVLAVVLSVAMGLDRLHLDTALCALVIFFGVGLVIRSYRGPAVPSAPLPVHTH
ncbi:DMT family transporter [Alistipes putredinis]